MAREDSGVAGAARWLAGALNRRLQAQAVAWLQGQTVAWRRGACLGCACLLVCAAAGAQARSSPAADTQSAAGEERVKAASVFKFLNYVDWPAATFGKPETPYVIGVLHADELAIDLGNLTTARTVNNRPIVIRPMRSGEALAGIHLLFVGKTERPQLAQLVRQLQQQPVLLITETDGALQTGSMINFRLVDERVRFEVALDAVEKAGLKLNSRLLAVAINVVRAQQ